MEVNLSAEPLPAGREGSDPRKAVRPDDAAIAPGQTATTARVSAVARRDVAEPALVFAFLVAGAALRFHSATAALAHTVWTIGLVIGGAPVVWRAAREVLRGHLASDVVALLAILASLWLRQPFAGLVVALMLSGGQLLERFAAGRASSALRALQDAAPRIAHRLVDGGVADVAVTGVHVGDRLLVRPGELVPCDGVVEEGSSYVDTASLTGEPVPRRAVPGTPLMSGSINGDGPLTVRATARAAESQYARIVELVRRAQASKAPLQRVADRYAVWFTPLTLVLCGVAYLLTHDPLRVLAVLVVATPCPLILAVPVAIVGGINRAARSRVIVRSGAALESLATVDTLVLDKTGTVTLARPAVSAVTTTSGATGDELLQLAASLEQHSGHLLARSVVDAATAAGLALLPVTDVRESAGRGIVGTVDGHVVAIGSEEFVSGRCDGPRSICAGVRHDAEGIRALVALDGKMAGAVEFADQVRPETRSVLGALRKLGLQRTILLSGDHAARVQAIGDALGIDQVQGEMLPGEKADYVARLADQGAHVLMVGDGTNDAPALARASVGVALAAHGRGVCAETADAAILGDDLSLVPEVISVARHTMRVARQSIAVGLGLSAMAMLFAGAGYIAPAVGALLQEAIDVTVILNALRAARN